MVVGLRFNVHQVRELPYHFWDRMGGRPLDPGALLLVAIAAEEPGQAGHSFEIFVLLLYGFLLILL